MPGGGDFLLDPKDVGDDYQGRTRLNDAVMLTEGEREMMRQKRILREREEERIKGLARENNWDSVDPKPFIPKVQVVSPE